ncbi:MAG TPA: T9SS type A sorting domain-containing protein [Flavobacteriales bacterium]
MRSFFSCFALLIHFATPAQVVNELERFFTTAQVQQVKGTPTGDVFVRGTFIGTLQLGDHSLTMAPSNNLGWFLAKRAANGEWSWLQGLEPSGAAWPQMDITQNGEIVLSFVTGAAATYAGADLGTTTHSARILHISPVDGSLLRYIHFPFSGYDFTTMALANGAIALAPHFDFMGSPMELPNGVPWSNTAETGVFILDADGLPTMVAECETPGHSSMVISDVMANGDLLLRVDWSNDPCTFQGLTLTGTGPGIRVELIRLTQQGEVVWHLPLRGPYPFIPSLPEERTDGEITFFLSTPSAVSWNGIDFPDSSTARIVLNGAGELVGHQFLDMSDVTVDLNVSMDNGSAFITGRYTAGVSVIAGHPQPPDAVGESGYLAHLTSEGVIDHVEYGIGDVYPSGIGPLPNDRYCLSLGFNSSATWAGVPLPYDPDATTQLRGVVTYGPPCMVTVIDSVTPATCDAPNGGGFALHVLGGVEPYTWLWNDGGTGPERTGLTGGVYEATVTDAEGCSVATWVHVPGPVGGLFPDLAGGITALPCFRPGMPTVISAWAWSPACVPVDAVLRVVLDPLVDYVGGMEPGDQLIGDTLLLALGPISMENPGVTRTLTCTTAPEASIGDSVCFDITLLPQDLAPDNNHFIACYPVVNSYDPNDKAVTPQGTGPMGAIDPGVRTLDYLIRFQNTGNAPAFNVFIDDTLDTDLDLAGLQVMGHSHPMELDIREGRVLRFRFDDIMLPDSANDEPNSHGFVAYRIPIRSDAAPGTVITNTAHIFFDLNPAVITNTTINTIELSTAVGEQSAQGDMLRLHPNPTADRLTVHSSLQASGTVAQLFDQQGRSVLHIPLGPERTTIDTHMLDAGVYILRIGAHSARFVKVDP